MNNSNNSSTNLYLFSTAEYYLNNISQLFPNTSLAVRLYQRLDLTNLRLIFYLTTPWESTFNNIEDVPNYNVQVSTWWITLIFIEFIILNITGHSDRFSLNDSITSVCAGMLSQCFKFGGRAIAIFGYIWVWNNLRIFELPLDITWIWVICLITQDFVYYLGHRAIHGIFWGLHTIHHSSQYFNLSTALRQAAIQDAGLAIYDILQAFFIPPPIFLVHRYFSEIFQFWMHTSLIGSLGPLGYILNTPSHHRVHHGRNPYCIDRNFGGVLIIWDRIFGTFESERLKDPPIYGLIKNENNFNQLFLQFHTLWELLFCKWREIDNENKIKIFPKFIDKLKAIYFPPGWYPGIKVKLFFHWFTLCESSYNVPEPEKPPIIYNPIIPRWLKFYILGHFLLLLCIFLHFEYDRLELDLIDFLLKIMLMFGAFFDLKKWAPLIELFRIFGVLIYYLFKIINEKNGFKLNRIFVASLFTFSGIFWLIYLFSQKLINWKKCKENKRKINILNKNKLNINKKDENKENIFVILNQLNKIIN
ncbi:Fatty acid hydroxylase domain-containing protein [Meloidogyne graminicola]|uniref:Fatty acid hydroxylase domain-containing protein n=1 Tax=Meloidogyne graminicola TaxID=189291 RepID=A0A8S9ZS07_9BILA|nr:Fatty acid hydroxylase domain-containing protein [Meloidogyne graminicola]